MSDEPVYQWQRMRIGSDWEDMPDPHPNSPLAAYRTGHGVTIDDGMGNRYRRIKVNP